jgi:hypothetical protein
MDTAQERTILRFVNSVFGTVEHIPIDSPRLERRVRASYRSVIDEVSAVGFTYLCSDGESFSLFRLLLVLPAVAMFGIWLQRTPISLRGGSILAGYPILIFKAMSTFAHLDGTPVKFLTSFCNGTLLVSGNYTNSMSGGPGITRSCQTGTIEETWTRHQTRIQALETEGVEVDRRNDYSHYVQMHVRDTAPW